MWFMQCLQKLYSVFHFWLENIEKSFGLLRKLSLSNHNLNFETKPEIKSHIFQETFPSIYYLHFLKAPTVKKTHENFIFISLCYLKPSALT